MTRLAGRVALVTGGLRGIGQAIVARFLEEGARVLITDLDDEGGADALGEAAAYQRLDVANDADWVRAFDIAEQRFGPVDILVNNAGISRLGNIENTPEADFRFIMDTNALGTFFGCQSGVRRMGQRGGVIINMSSARALRTGADNITYYASKAAVLSMTESIAIHCGNAGLPIRCNAICPGVVETPQVRRHARDSAGNSDGEAAMRAMAALQTMGRLGMPREIGDAAVFLASDEASFITGTALRVDGGFAIRD